MRDLLDRMVDGQLAAAAAAPGSGTLRWQTRRFTAGHPVMNWLLMYLMSGGIDRPIRRWEEMFLPLELERNAAGLRYVDPQGRERALVSGPGDLVSGRRAGAGAGAAPLLPAADPRAWGCCWAWPPWGWAGGGRKGKGRAGRSPSVRGLGGRHWAWPSA